MIPVTNIGCRAQAILERTTEPLRVLAALSGSTYLTAAGTVLWLGPTGAALHPRAMLTSTPVRPPSPTRIDLRTAQVWRPSPLDPGPGAARSLRRTAHVLADAAGELGEPEGFGALLVDRAPAFPLTTASAAATALAHACTVDDPQTAVSAACALLGLGPGLTPAGDDFVGGVFFARAQLARLDGHASAGWRSAAAAVRRAARDRTSRISAALLDDLTDGAGYAPLHDLTTRLAEGHSLHQIASAARRLTRLGHSSGWDLLAGLLTGLGALHPLIRRVHAPVSFRA